jgi:hypothetical protein
MALKGQFLCISKTAPPQVHVIDQIGMQSLNDRLRVASKRDSEAARVAAYRFAFGFECDYAIPCWEPAALEAIAVSYPGTDENADLVRYLAAAIALGETFGADRGDDGETEGGLKVECVPDPKPLAPTGAARLFDLVQS